MTNIKRDIETMFPNVAGLFDNNQLNTNIGRLIEWFQENPRRLTVPQKKYSRGFWNTILLATIAERDMALASLWRLAIADKGLAEAKRAHKERKFRNTLTNDEAGFDQALAELFVIGALGPAFPTIDLERPGAKKGKNYDLHLERPDSEVHVDVKWRTETPVGDAAPDLLDNLHDLMGKDVDRTVYLKLRRNRLSEGDQIRAVCIVADALSYVRSGDFGPQLSKNDIILLPEDLRSQGLHLHFLQEEVHRVNLAGVDALYTPGEATFFLAEPTVDSLEIDDGDPAVVIIPKGETRAVFSKEMANGFGNPRGKRQRFDFENPESGGIADLLNEVYNQLPTGGTNIIGLGVFDPSSFEDAEYALFGEPACRYRKPDPHINHAASLT